MAKKHAFGFIGRFQPPTAGHGAAASEIKEMADSVGADHFIFGTHSEGDKKNPLPPDLKLKHMKVVLNTPNVFIDPSVRKPPDLLQRLHDMGYKKITLVAGGSRAEEYERFRKYVGKKTVSSKTGEVLDLSNIHPDDFKIHKIERDADSDTGGTEIEPHMIDRKTGKMKLAFVSGSRVRAAVNGPLEHLASMMPSHMTIEEIQALQRDLQKHMGLHEEVSALTRVKLARAAKRTAKRRQITRRIREKKRRSIPQLKVRAKNEIISELRKRVYKGNWKKLSYSQRVSIDRNISKRKKLVNMMVKRIMPQVLKGESERLRRVSTRKNINAAYEPILNIFLSNYLTESSKVASRKSRTSKESNRQPPDQAKKAERRRDNTLTQRKTRGRHKESLKAGDVKGRIFVVKNKSGELEIVDKKSIRKDHEIIVDSKDATIGKVRNYLKNPAFVNTKTSIELFGPQDNADGKGGSKTKKSEESRKQKSKKEKSESTKGKKEQKKKSKTQTTPQESALPQIDLSYDSRWTMPKNKGFKAADYEWAFTTLAEMMINGENPEKLIKSGAITQEQYLQLSNNKNLIQATLRVLQNSGFMGSEKGRYKFIHSGRGLGQDNSDLYKSLGATDTTPKADVFILDTKNPKASMGISFKAGAAQLGSSKEKETKAMATYAYEKTKDSMDGNCRTMVEDLIKDGFDQMANSLKLPGGVNVFKKDTGGVGTRNPAVKKAVEESIKTNKKLEASIAKIFEECKPFKKAILRETATGEGKNQGQYSKFIMKEHGVKVDAGTATHILAISDDSSNASLIQMDDKFFDELEPNVKMYVAAKTTDADTSAEIKEYKETKKLLTEAAKANDSKQFKKLVEQRVYAGYVRKGLKPPSLNEKELKEMQKSVAETGNLPNVLKFKLMQPKSALRFGVAGQESKEIDESILYNFFKRYIKENAIVSISSDLDKNDGNNRSVYDELMELKQSGDLEDVNPNEWMQMSKEYVGDDLMKYLDFMGVELSRFGTNEINFDELFGNKYSSQVNTVYINGRPKYIPVLDSVTESILTEKRNYRQEYDRYHSKPEQRANRSKRVLARRLMMKLGRVKKGDGKDVDHKDGDPQNNGKHNLRVRDKSENRADND